MVFADALPLAVDFSVRPAGGGPEQMHAHEVPGGKRDLPQMAFQKEVNAAGKVVTCKKQINRVRFGCHSYINLFDRPHLLSSRSPPLSYTLHPIIITLHPPVSSRPIL